MANKTSPTEITLTYAKQILRVRKLHLQQHKIYAILYNINKWWKNF